MKTGTLTDQNFDKPLNRSFGEVANQLAFTLRGRACAWKVSSATPDAVCDVEHDLGTVPIGYVLIGKRTKAAEIYHNAGDEAFWTATNIRVRSDTASTTFRIAVVSQD